METSTTELSLVGQREFSFPSPTTFSPFLLPKTFPCVLSTKKISLWRKSFHSHIARNTCVKELVEQTAQDVHDGEKLSFFLVESGKNFPRRLFDKLLFDANQGDSWCFIASTREFLLTSPVLNPLACFLSLPHKKATHFRTNDEIYFHCELEFISFDWEHGVMENILMFYVPYIRKCYNPKNYIKYNTILAIIVVVDSCADVTLCALLCVILAVPTKRWSTILFSILWNIQQVKHKI